MDYLHEMALFVEVARTASFKQAADSLNMPTSTLSRRIAKLERAVGVRLLNRTTRSVELTEAGSLYYQRCRDIVEAARVAHESLGDIVDRPQGRLRISTTVEFARLYFAPLISAYTTLYPGVTLEIDLNPNRVDLIAQNYDLALRVGPQLDSGLVSRRLGILRTTLFASPEFLSKLGCPERPEDLSRYPVVRNLNAPRPDVWVLTRNDKTVEVPVNGSLLVNNFGFMRQMALEGMGIVMLHEPIVLPDVRNGHLKRVLPEWFIREAPVYALMPSRLIPAKTRLFLEMLSTQVSPQLSATFGTIS